MKSFLDHYLEVVISAIGSHHRDNHDEDRFGKKESRPRSGLLARALLLLSKVGLLSRKKTLDTMRRAMSLVAPHLAEVEWLYAKLGDDESRDILVCLMAYRSLGPLRFKLPNNNPDYWKKLKQAESLGIPGDNISSGTAGWTLQKFKLESIGIPVELYFTRKGVCVDFMLQQYRCNTASGVISAEPGDVVIDGGGCWGDTALYFSHLVGPHGRVVSFEFLPENLEIFERNLHLNPEMASRVRILHHPLWSSDEEELAFTPAGPGTRIANQDDRTPSIRIPTISLDGLHQKGELERVDFIKLDIEGAELEALKGAEYVIRKFTPKLAVTVYHRLEDFWTIPRYLDALGLGYEFYLRHFTIHSEETVLFARKRKEHSEEGGSHA